MKEAILEMLAVGRESPATISAICGCTPSYISQLLADSNFVQQVKERKRVLSDKSVDTLAATEVNSHDTHLDILEGRLMTKIGSLIPMLNKPMEAAKVFQIINAAKRKNDSVVNTTNIFNQQNNVVVLNLPAAVKGKLLVNQNNEVVQVDERPLTTMDSQLLLKVNKEAVEAKEFAKALTKMPLDELLKEI